MKTLGKTPQRLPTVPTLIREYAGHYAIWTGRNWHGSIDKFSRGWRITTPSSPGETLNNFNAARAEAEHRALRAEGKV